MKSSDWRLTRRDHDLGVMGARSVTEEVKESEIMAGLALIRKHPRPTSSSITIVKSAKERSGTALDLLLNNH